MKMKQLIQRSITKDESLVDAICDIFQKDDAWVYISTDLFQQLRTESYSCISRPDDNGFSFSLKNGGNMHALSVHSWYEVDLFMSQMGDKILTASSDPTVVVFLSNE